MCVFCVKQKTAYEMRISDWSSDVCSSDLGKQGGADMGSVARRSSESWTVTSTGKANHSSGIFSAESGDGAIYELARIVHRFRTDLPEPNLTFNVGLIAGGQEVALDARSEEHTSELQSLMRISYAVFCLKKKKTQDNPSVSETSVNQQTDQKRRSQAK